MASGGNIPRIRGYGQFKELLRESSGQHIRFEVSSLMRLKDAVLILKFIAQEPNRVRIEPACKRILKEKADEFYNLKGEVQTLKDKVQILKEKKDEGSAVDLIESLEKNIFGLEQLLR